jgi:hypothetical protein
MLGPGDAARKLKLAGIAARRPAELPTSVQNPLAITTGMPRSISRTELVNTARLCRS